MKAAVEEFQRLTRVRSSDTKVPLKVAFREKRYKVVLPHITQQELRAMERALTALPQRVRHGTASATILEPAMSTATRGPART